MEAESVYNLDNLYNLLSGLQSTLCFSRDHQLNKFSVTLKNLRKTFLAILLGLLPSTSMAFKWEGHKLITRTGLAGVEPRAMQEIIDGNLSVDKGKLEKYKPGHFDNDTFRQGSGFIVKHFNQAIDLLGLCQSREARKHFGMVLHTIQDFYAHSNYVEKKLAGQNIAIDLFNLTPPPPSAVSKRISDSCCKDMGQTQCLSTRLTTGFWKRDSLRINRCGHDMLSKDEVDHKYHQQAVTMASEATAQILRKMVRTLLMKFGEQKTNHLIELFSNTQTVANAQFCPASHGSRNASECPTPPIEFQNTERLEHAVQTIMTRLLEREYPPDLTL